MNAVLEHPELLGQAAPLSVSMYHALGDLGLIEENTELIEGFILPKMPKSPRHRILTKRLLVLLNSCLPDGCSLWKGEPLTLANSEPEPDLAIVRGQDDDFAIRHPDTAEIVVEVPLSSMARDMVKAGLYAQAGVREYWLVDGDKNWVDVHTLPSTQGYTKTKRYGSGETLVSTVIPSLEISVDALFA